MTPSEGGGVKGAGLCGKYVCLGAGIPIITTGTHAKLRCNNVTDCSNTDVDEAGCDRLWFKCGADNQSIALDRVCDGSCDCVSNCRDESNCTGTLKGIYCTSTLHNTRVYLGPDTICNGLEDCVGGADEEGCGFSCNKTFTISTLPPTEVVHDVLLARSQICDDVMDCDNFTDDLECVRTGGQPQYYETCNGPHHTVMGTLQIGLNDLNKCSAMAGICKDTINDQLNCTEPDKRVLKCLVGGYPTYLSEQVVCSGSGVCDDGMDDKCVDLGGGCVVHVHRLCDRVRGKETITLKF